ncbi:MAG: DUF4831 family protein [Muribaculaceae bacterium]|nr:DUF4831 family protein [Muribaculaceae bacterium]
MKHTIAAIAILAAAAIPAAAQTTQRITAGKASEYGLTYSLPLTAVDITVEAEISESKPGEFHNYARRHLAIDDAIHAPAHTAAIRSVTIRTHGEPDPDSQWLVQFKSGTSPFMTLSEQGLPLSVNTDADATGAGVDTEGLPVSRPAAPTALETEAARQAVTQEMTRSSSLSKRAELAAQRIFELREMRSDILGGQAENTPPDGQAMKLILDNIAAQEAALTAMFAGTTATRTEVRTLTIVPDSADTDSRVLARISPVEGIIDADNLAGAPLTVSITATRRAELPLTDKGEPKRFPKGGFAYTIPGEATVAVSYGGQTVATATVSLAQLGTVFGIDPAVFTDKKAPSALRLDPATGAIISLEPVGNQR